MPIYDDFSAMQLDTGLWAPVVPGEGFAAATLQVELVRGECCLSLAAGKANAAKSQSVLLSTRTWEVGREPLDFSTTVAAKSAAEGTACAAFGIFDAAGGTVVGVAATGRQLLAVARESGDPLAPLATGALEFSELGVTTVPMQRHDVKIEYDPQRRIARWYVDEVMRLYREVPFDPREFTCAFGIIPLRALAQEDSPRITATFGPILYSDESELEPDPFYSAMPG